ncbi:MAG TPA: diacylglycerol kinase family protein [Streptosporangiaceae bacterium]|jgi:YegS/Rv2252/BmrU family lipid kinase
MTDSWCLVVNPAAGNGRCRRRLPTVLSALNTGPAGVQVCETASLSHAAEVAAAAAGRGEKVVAVGGDGLVGSVAGALAGTGGVLGIIPAGRGNDFARMLEIPFSTADAARALLTGQPRAVDLMGVRAGDGPEQVVAGSVYLGIPSAGAELANRSRLPASAVKYQVAGVRATLAWEPVTFTVDGAGDHDGAGDLKAASFPGQAVVVANSGYFAAGTLAAPTADVSDGLLDVIMVTGGRKLSFLRVMLAANRGTHLRLSQVSTLRSESVTVTADREMPAGADGEPLTHASPLPAGTPLLVRAIPAALMVLSPVPATGQSPARQPPAEQVTAEPPPAPRQPGEASPPARQPTPAPGPPPD